jgi:hypothetical protein
MKLFETALATFMGAFLALVAYATLVRNGLLGKYIKEAFDVFDPSIDGFESMNLQAAPTLVTDFEYPAGTRKTGRH